MIPSSACQPWHADHPGPAGSAATKAVSYTTLRDTILVDPADEVSGPIIAKHSGIKFEELPLGDFYCRSARVIASVPFDEVERRDLALMMPNVVDELARLLDGSSTGESPSSSSRRCDGVTG